MNFIDSIKCIYYNYVANFYICLNYIIPCYQEEVINLNYKVIEIINEEFIFKNHSRKRKRFDMFIDHIIQKNNDFIEKIRAQEKDDEDISNYEKAQNTNEIVFSSESEASESEECDGDENNDYDQNIEHNHQDMSEDSEDSEDSKDSDDSATTIIETDKKNV